MKNGPEKENAAKFLMMVYSHNHRMLAQGKVRGCVEQLFITTFTDPFVRVRNTAYVSLYNNCFTVQDTVLPS